MDVALWLRRNGGMGSVSEFEDRMKRLAEQLSPEAKIVVMQVLTAEHKRRFSTRAELPEAFANAALKAAKGLKEGDK